MLLRKTLMKSISKISFVVVVCVVILLEENYNDYHLYGLYNILGNSRNITFKQSLSITSKVDDNHQKCPSVLDKMVVGYWNSKPLTKQQSFEMTTFLNASRTHHRLPSPLQRVDLKCGNLTFPLSFSPAMKWFRAVCDPHGKTPCCYNNKCSSRTIEQCKCRNCYDMRQYKHGEYSDFIPNDTRCKLRKYNHTEACQLLDDATLYLNGDSYIRHLYTALLLFLRNNTFDGAMKKGVPKDKHDKCTGMYMFTEKLCRGQLDHNVKDLCHGRFRLMFTYYYKSISGRNFVKMINSIKHARKSLVVFGIGIHDGFNVQNIANKFIAPVVKTIGNKTWPKLLWATPHCPSILNLRLDHQVPRFIAKMEPVLYKYNVPVFNTYNMTKGMVSFDGSHYGLGINMWKLQILLNYIQSLKDKGAWNI
ncbi:hypothetical protein SNE40_023486 [Patella caerulea]|uniref:Uncharacterized protein n=2 Tax=Patella caerulea TaxID=87958 RepID=A0AAN8G398_PATCE